MRPRHLVLLALALGVARGAEEASAPPTEPPQGSAEAGRRLFTGERRMEKGGAPCGACHALAGEGLALSASLGPELSASLAAAAPADVDGLLEALPFPTMTPIYGDRPLTAQERADLTAFLVEAARQPARGRGPELALGVAVALAVVLAGLLLAWRSRRAPSRARVLRRAAASTGGAR